jgi:chromosome segregation ATPase
MSENTAVLSEMRESVQQRKDKWIETLDETVAKISNSFSRSFDSIGCAGQVSVNKAGDFSEWGIEIWVKFRYFV